MYYSTEGNVTNSSFVFGNTGSFTVTQNSTNIRLISNANIPLDEERHFTLQIRHDSPTGLLVATSNTVILVDSANAFMSATGGTQSNISNYRLHTFTTSANLTIVNPGKLNQIEYLVVGGGGTGGQGGTIYSGGGGGGGGVLFGTFAPPTAFAPGITATVGAAGGFSKLLTANATTGGTGGSTSPGQGISGGSGGGARSIYSPAGLAGGAGISGQGNPGGSNPAIISDGIPFANNGAAGGGGGGAVGQDAGFNGGGGGVGLTWPGNNTTYAGGGGGGVDGSFKGQTGYEAGNGGTGGGGKGGKTQSSPSDNYLALGGEINTGGGGGGGAAQAGYTSGVHGGSGIVIVRYRTS
jgi:hypothetical protein